MFSNILVLRRSIFISTIVYTFLMPMGGDHHFNDVEIQTPSKWVEFSQHFLLAIKENKPTQSYVAKLSSISQNELASELKADQQKLAFWINIYNSFILVYLKDDPSEYQKRNAFFDKKRINIGGKILSFSNIEHGIIRRSQWAYGLGLIRSPFRPKYQRLYCPSYREPRVHFALNCGAKSCPPVAVLSAENLEKELDYLSERYLKENTTVTSPSVVETTILFSWFRGDFGGKNGIKSMLVKYGIIKSADVSLKFGDYDWNLDLDNFIELPNSVQ